MAQGRYRGLALLVCVALSPAAVGAERPSFHLDHCGWHATHIVVVTEGDRIDGAVEVVESWRGDLQKGDRLRFPELASVKRTIFYWPGQRAPGQPTEVSGSRMVLFLRRQAEARDRSKTIWLPASSENRMEVSVVWIEQEQVHAMVQEINPGPTCMRPVGTMTELLMRVEVRALTALQNALTRALALPDRGKRAEVLARLVRTDRYYVREAGFKALGGCGKDALPVLRRLLRDDSLARHHGDIVRVLTRAGGAAVGPELTTLVEQELGFWKRTGPALPAGWWNGGPGLPNETVARLRDRYGLVLWALRGLTEVRCAESKKVVTEFRDFWRSLPQLENKSGLNEMSQECDRVLAGLKK